MPLYYKAVQSTIKSKDGKKKWHPRIVKSKKTVDSQKLGEMIAEKSSLTPGDVHNVIRNLMSVMKEQLMNSRSVQLEGLGSFTVIAHSNMNGVDTAKEVNPHQITNLRIQFTPTATRTPMDGTTRAIFTGAEFERWDGTSEIDPETHFAVNTVARNEVIVAERSGELGVSAGDVLKITGTKLSEVALKVKMQTTPTGSPLILALSGIGTVNVTDALITINVTINNADIDAFLRGDTDETVYVFE
ncbi:MAG: HU family DNA-binding protein [Mediterranea sp.]|jgi:predicted histone-like DNA-binding protein|nr:HU family DNA-binding protein [Mediterranea sp.]